MSRTALSTMLVVSLVAFACTNAAPGDADAAGEVAGDTVTPTTPATPDQDTPLQQTRWRLVQLGSDTVPPSDSPDQGPWFRLTSDTAVEGHAGCNHLSGDYTSEGESIDFGTLITTRMACPILETETRFLQALETARRYRIADGSLELLDGAGEVVAAFAAVAGS